MTTKTRPTSSRIMLLSLTASLFLTATKANFLNTGYLTTPPEISLQNLDRAIGHVLPKTAVPIAGSGNTGILQPVSGLVGSLLSPAPAHSADRIAVSKVLNTDSATTAYHIGLLAPITGLVNGLLGTPPR